MRIPRIPLAALLCLVVAGCGAAPVEPPAPHPPASPAPSLSAQAAALAAKKTPEERAAAKQGTGCEAEPKEREAAFCYLKSESEASIDPLFSLGRSLAARAVDHPVSYWPDFEYASDNAGILAAKTSDARLFAGAKSASEVDQHFAVRALRHMLATLRWGHAKGKEADAVTRKERLPAVHAVCLEKLGAKDAGTVAAAAECLKEVGDAADAAALVDAAVAGTEVEHQARLVEIATGFHPVPEASLKKLVPLLEKPIGQRWTQGEVFLRAGICRLLLREVDARATWPRKPAEVAVREIGGRNSQAKEPCEKLASRVK